MTSKIALKMRQLCLYNVILLTHFPSAFSFICPWPDGFFPNGNDCNAYWICTDSIAIAMRCPAGLNFDPALDVCDFVECPVSTSTPVATSITTTGTTTSTAASAATGAAASATADRNRSRRLQAATGPQAAGRNRP